MSIKAVRAMSMENTIIMIKAAAAATMMRAAPAGMNSKAMRAAAAASMNSKVMHVAVVMTMKSITMHVAAAVSMNSTVVHAAAGMATEMKRLQSANFPAC